MKGATYPSHLHAGQLMMLRSFVHKYMEGHVIKRCPMSHLILYLWIGRMLHNIRFYERAPAGSSESIDGTGKIRGMEEGEW